MDVLLGIRPAPSTEEAQRVQARLHKQPGLTQKAMDAYDRRLHQTRQARTRMEGMFADALGKLDQAYEEQLQREEAARMLARPAQSHRLPSMEYLVDYRPCVGQFQLAVDRMVVQYRKYEYVPTKSAVERDPFYDQRGYQGDEVLRKFREVMDNFPDKPTAMQKRFLEASFSTMAHLIYGDAYANDPESILTRNKWTETNGILALLTGRKTGKSTACAMLVIIVMMCIQSAQVIVTSRTLKQAQIILNTVRVLIRVHPLFRKWGFKLGELSNTTTLTFEGPDGSIRQIEAYATHIAPFHAN